MCLFEFIIFIFFFFWGHGNESCNLIGYLPGQYFPISATVTLSWVTAYIPTFVAIFDKYISFFRLGSILKQRRRLLPQADK